MSARFHCSLISWLNGQVADAFGVLRSGGNSECARFVVDIKRIIRCADVHNIKEAPSSKPSEKSYKTIEIEAPLISGYPLPSPV